MMYAQRRKPEFLCNEEGGILLLWAVLMPVVAGMVGLGLETGTWYLKKRDLQSAADAAAIAGAYETNAGARDNSARNSVSRNGFSGVNITVNNPPHSGSNTTNNDAVEVILSQQQPLLFAGLFLSSPPTISVRAVAVRNITNTGNTGACVLALNPADSGAINTSGTTNLDMPNCTLVANSPNSSAIQFRGGATANINGIYTMGDYSTSNNATVTTGATAVTHAPYPVADPYSNLTTPSSASCNYNSMPNGSSLSPGVYCNGFSLGSHANVTMQPGVYVIKGGGFQINSGASLSGTGVTIILTGSGSSYSTVNINGGSSVNLTAPTSGTYAGVAFYQDRAAPAGSQSTFNGGSGMYITGAVYMPRGSVTYSGGNSSSTPTCTQLVSYNVTFTGNSYITNNCPATGMDTITTSGSSSAVSLVE